MFVILKFRAIVTEHIVKRLNYLIIVYQSK